MKTFVSVQALLRRAVLLPVAGLCLWAGASTSSAQTYLFDLGAAANTTEHAAAPDDPLKYWNNIPEAVGTATNGVLTNIVSSENVLGRMGFAIVQRFNGANLNGTTASTLFPAEATRDSLYGNTAPFNNLSNIFPSFKLTGLDPASRYDFTFYASRTGVGDNRETAYTLAGANNGLAVLNPANNIDSFTTATGMLATAEGEITISLAPTENNNNATRFTYLGVLKVEVIPPQTPIGFTQEPINVRVAQFEPATFAAAVTGAPPYFIQWLSNGTAIPGANQLTYTIPVATLDMSGSLFSVNVSNLAYSITSSNAALRVVTDTNPPLALAASSADGLTVQVCFNEPLEPGTASESSNFMVNDILPISSVLSVDGKCVTLDLGGQSVSGTFTVRVDFLVDLSGNQIADGTLVTGEVPRPEQQLVLVDFGAAATTDLGPAPADDPARYWNNLSATIGQNPSGVLSPLVTTQNLVTPYGVAIVSRFNGANESGTTLATAPYPTDATRDSLFGNTEGFGGQTNVFPSFKLTGLNPAKAYDLTFYASRTGVADNRETLYTVTGISTASTALNAANNVTNTARLAGVVPNGAGEILVAMTPGPNNNNANHFTYLGVLALAPGTAQSRFVTPTVIGGTLNFQWSGAGQLQSAPTVTGPWEDITPNAPNAHSEAVVPTGNRYYRLRLP